MKAKKRIRQKLSLRKVIRKFISESLNNKKIDLEDVVFLWSELIGKRDPIHSMGYISILYACGIQSPSIKDLNRELITAYKDFLLSYQGGLFETHKVEMKD